MKKHQLLMIMLLCLLMMGCSNDFAQREYDSDQKIAQTADRYAESNSTLNKDKDGFSFVASEFDGRETLWKDTVKEKQDITMEISFSVSGGKAKVVHINEDGNVTTILECTSETVADGVVTKEVSLSEGKNRLKIVGYDCRDIDLEVSFSENGE